jgi:RNA recognition motif-containing protein
MVLFIGNISIITSRKDLEKLFAPFGIVEAVQIVMDSVTHRSRGFAYIRMETTGDGLNAINNLHNALFMGKTIVVTDKGPLHPVRTKLSKKITP